MAVNKSDKSKVNQQLLHLGISLLETFLCVAYINLKGDWSVLGKFWHSLIIPIVFAGEVIRTALVRYFERSEIESSAVMQKLRQKKPTVSVSMVNEILIGLALQGFCTVMYALTCMILGAPVLNNYEKTWVLAVLLTLFTVSTTVLLLGPGGALRLCFCEKPEFITRTMDTALNSVKFTALGALLGAWAGSVAAPLDWDRDWQEYPVPNVMGMLIGSSLGNSYICGKTLIENVKGTFAKKSY